MELLKNYIGGKWLDSREAAFSSVVNPATQEILGRVPVGPGTSTDVDEAVKAAQVAFKEWSQIPVMQRVQPLYKLKQLIEDNLDDLANTITLECGKTKVESLGELQRAIENIEAACATPLLIQSEFSENIARGVDEFMIRQPLGVCACIAPFNFPGMIPFWFLPYAIACGNTFVLKPSEKVPLTMMKVFSLIEKIGLPAGVVSLVHGGKETVDALLDHPDIKAISFVGSTAIAKYVYSRGAANGKRVQAQGGAKNPVVILPDADLEVTSKVIADSVYGCAGQRCLAASTIISVGDEKGEIKDALYETAKQRTTGFGLLPDVEMGPVISRESKKRIESLIQQGIQEGGQVLLDGRNTQISGFEKGNFLRPTILENIPLNGELIKTEIFGPVMTLLSMKTVEDALAFINGNRYGNMACIFTTSGASARKFRSEANAGNIGVNIGVAAPMAQFPFSGWNESFFGDLHGQGRHAIEFFTQTKIVIERWPKEWSRKF
ncbi:methylmalonate-semialdehyde dehydrogenase (acylating) [Leadbetterella byssophila DSM 17132]|uniref:methylmalonate-semialdehyde dehydrogenase (CoA acylating) n=1 Tax=Leadbetterella byssophila (strain DSM 17132 / JCM 16389 / KACC 11308 / NBRC 106382 / 4M15) TaxID=649349 RepID=E4RRI4_LEAB4|nr:CoA-acylating methylmalonate-semialdehyde dehydrogenase [Leadbetterella byssophila]ADQ15813.1 methylmalonate-semialdehyde dehydrogenase (acylating) [Leadbetterella byssophila DSM 17132]